MATEWKYVELDSVCELIVDCVNRTAPVVDYVTPYRMIRTTDVKDGRIDLTNSRHVSKQVFDRWARRGAPRKGDVVLTREAPLGEVGIISEENVFLGQRLMMFRPNSLELDSRFLLYSFLGSELHNQVMNLGRGSTVEHMRVPDAKKLRVKIPPIEEQHAIADVLGSLDDKIELNRRMNAALEETARALFKSWFVDFDPVRAKMEGREPVGMDAETAALFPDRLVESELGPIPEGWNVCRLGEIIELAYGKPLKAETRQEGAIPAVSYTHLTLPTIYSV